MEMRQRQGVHRMGLSPASPGGLPHSWGMSCCKVTAILNTPGILGSGWKLCRATDETLPEGLFHPNNCGLLPLPLPLSHSCIASIHLLSRVHLHLPRDSLLHTSKLLPACGHKRLHHLRSQAWEDGPQKGLAPDTGYHTLQERPSFVMCVEQLWVGEEGEAGAKANRAVRPGTCMKWKYLLPYQQTGYVTATSNFWPPNVNEGSQNCDPLEVHPSSSPLHQWYMPSSHLILWYPLLLLPSIFPNIRDLSNESAVCIRWPKYWSFSFSILNLIPDLWCSDCLLPLLQIYIAWLSLLPPWSSFLRATGMLSLRLRVLNIPMK